MRYYVPIGQRLAIHEPAAQDFAESVRRLSPPKVEAYSQSYQPAYHVVDRVAEIKIEGPLVNMPPWVEWFGFASYERIRRDAWAAASDPDVTAIRLLINSPGGWVDGCFETQQVLSRIAEQKPIIESEIQSMGTSAGYCLAAVANKIICHEGSTVGSIGTIATMYGDKGFLSQMGLTRRYIISNVSPYKNTDPEFDEKGEPQNPEGLAQIQYWLNRDGEVFVDRIGLLRGLTREEVLKKYGQGKFFVGRDALDAGLVDALIEGVTGKRPEENRQEEATMRKPKRRMEEEVESPEEETESYDEAAESESIGDETETSEASADIARIQAIDDLKITGHDEFIYKAKYVLGLTPEEVKAHMFDVQRGATTDVKERLKRSVDRSKERGPLNPATPPSGEGMTSGEKETVRAAAEKAYKGVRKR